MRKIIVIALLGVSSCLTEADKELGTPDTFVRLLNGGQDDTAQDIKQTGDGGFIVLGTTEIINTTDQSSRYKIKLIKLNKYGHVEWAKNYPDYDSEIDSISYKGRFLLLDNNTSDGSNGYLIVGDSIQVGEDPYIRVMITDSEGNVQKSTTIGDRRYQGLEGFAATTDDTGDYVILGSIKNQQGTNQGDEDMFLAGLNKNLETTWVRSYGSGATIIVNRLFNDGQSTSLLWGGSVSKNGLSDIRLVKTPPNSQSVEFDFPIGDTDNSETAEDICEYGFGLAFIGSSNLSGNEDILLKQVNQEGIEIFSKTYGVIDHAEGGLAIAPTVSGGLILLGFTENSEVSNGLKDFYLIKIDAVGEVQWEKIIGGRNDEVGARVIALAGGGFVILGTSSFGGLSSIAVLKVDDQGNLN